MIQEMETNYIFISFITYYLVTFFGMWLFVYCLLAYLFFYSQASAGCVERHGYSWNVQDKLERRHLAINCLFVYWFMLVCLLFVCCKTHQQVVRPGRVDRRAAIYGTYVTGTWKYTAGYLGSYRYVM